MKGLFVCFLALLIPLAGCGEKFDHQPSAPEVNTVILKEEDENMVNIYTLLAVNPDAPFVDAGGQAVEGVIINTAGAGRWLRAGEFRRQPVLSQGGCAPLLWRYHPRRGGDGTDPPGNHHVGKRLRSAGKPAACI